jgi:hypothetical protein
MSEEDLRCCKRADGASQPDAKLGASCPATPAWHAGPYSLIITSDHGENIDHGLMSHALPHDTLIRAPDRAAGFSRSAVTSKCS